MRFKFEATETVFSPGAGLRDGAKTTLEFEEATLPAVLDAFQQFLAGCGFQVRYGEIQQVQEEEIVVTREELETSDESPAGLVWREPSTRSMFAPDDEEELL